MCNKSIADRKQHAWMESQLAILATDTGTTFAKLFQVEGIQTILFKFWAFRVYTLHNLTPIRLFCVKGRFSGLSGIKTHHVWPEIRSLGFKGITMHLLFSDCLNTQNFFFALSQGKRFMPLFANVPASKTRKDEKIIQMHKK